MRSKYWNAPKKTTSKHNFSSIKKPLQGISQDQINIGMTVVGVLFTGVVVISFLSSR